ncbi:hypothetical protein [Streptomyces sp. NPDC002640]
MTVTTTAVIRAGDAATTVTSSSRLVTDWAARYFTPWWITGPARTDHPAPSPGLPHVRAEVDRVRWKEIER